jgi:purine nucleosidase/pyrimidine-specific ribonucleoside hydrolase
MAQQSIVLDTDIGEDIDDAYALAMILTSPELNLRAVTTVFHRPVEKARLAQTILQLHGREDIPVAAGCATPISQYLSPKVDDVTHRPIDAEEVLTILDRHFSLPQLAFAKAANELPPLAPHSAVEFLIDAFVTGDGQTTLITIGQMTNIASAIRRQPEIVRKIPRIVCMAADFWGNRVEWNVAWDPVAAATVIHSGIPMTFLSYDVTHRCELSLHHKNALAASPNPLAKLLTQLTLARGVPRVLLHDPLTIEMLIQPGLFETQTGTVTVELTDPQRYGRTTFAPGVGPHTVAVDVDIARACDFWLSRVTSSADLPTPTGPSISQRTLPLPS